MKTNTSLFEVIVGTYEEFVLGYQFLFNVNKYELNQSFAIHSHKASVRSITCKGKFAVSGGADEAINIYNMNTRKESGMLLEHNGTITSLNFAPDCSHLISTSEDGSIKIFRQGSWQLEKAWPKAHKGTAVTCLAVHPSGKMALSVGRDHTLRTWNLVKGRQAYTTNLASRCQLLENVVWSPGGILFAVTMDTKLELSSTVKGGVFNVLQFMSKVTACVFLSDEVVSVGEASGLLSAYNTNTADQLWKLNCDQRIRGLAYLHNHLVTITSRGTISVYSITNVTAEPQLVTFTETGCRLTCLTLYDCKSEDRVKKEPSNEKSERSLTKKVKKPISGEMSDSKAQISTTKKFKVTIMNYEKDQLEASAEVKVMCSPRSQKWTVEDSKR